jgi:succinate dehydrogenase/fumarate reductase cytochrome b subunit
MKTMDSLTGKVQPVGMRNMISQCIKARISFGIGYLYAWLHRLSGICLFLFLWMHIYTLSFLSDPEKFDVKVAWLDRIGLSYLEWLLAVPVIFHALNGGRLILYELFNSRQDGLLSKWVAGLSVIYTIILLIIMYVSNISIAPSTWVIVWLFSLGVTGIVIIGTSASKIGLPWKFQRISGGFLLLMIPVHMVLMHANPMVGHDAGTIIERLQGDVLIKVADITMVIAALYHGAYGLVSIAKDYLESEKRIRFAICLVGIGTLFFGWLGIKSIVVL